MGNGHVRLFFWTSICDSRLENWDVFFVSPKNTPKQKFSPVIGSNSLFLSGVSSPFFIFCSDMQRFFGVFFFLSFMLSDVFATRPQLVDKRLWFVNRTVLNYEYEVAVAQMEFDQEMYLAGGGESFLCGLAEETCLERDCVPCDWSSQQPTGCDNVECCGPAQKGGDAWDQVNGWCEPAASDPPYHTLNLHERSEVFFTEPGETLYFRFFVSEEFSCKPFKLKLRPYYGQPVVFLSNLYAVPTPENAQWRKGTIPATWGIGQNNMLVICPDVADSRLGTYSLGVFSSLSSSFDVEIIVSPQDYPLVPPPDRILCEDVPESEIIGAQAGSEQEVICLQDTETVTFDYDSVTWHQFILPITPGCHQVSLAAVAEPDFLPALHCHPRDPNSPLAFFNSLSARWTLGQNRLTFSMCPDTVTYVRCAITFWRPGPTHVIFSTVSIPDSIPLDPSANTPAASFTYQESLTAISPVVFGTSQPMCGDYGSSRCWYWMVPSLADPLIFWPPPSQLTVFDTGSNVYEEYYKNSVAEPLKNTVTFVIVMAAEGTTIFSRDQLDEVSLTFLYLTNDLGEPPVLPNNAIYPEGESAASPGQYLPSIAMSSFPQLDLSELCDRTSYDRLQVSVDNELAQVLESNSLDTIEFRKYVLDILGAGIASTSCTEAAIEAMNTQVESITLVDQTFCPFELGTEEYATDPCCNDTLKSISCCVPFTITDNQEQFTTADSSTCGIPECADTYFEDLARSLNHVKDLIQGCSSGVKNIQWELASATEKQLNHVVRSCLNQVGLRDDFKGIDCVADFECEEWSGRCNHQTKKCMLETTSEVEDAYLECYISKMSSSLEEYLRLNVLPPEVAESAPRDSEEFFLALKAAASVDDCVATNEPLDIFLRSRYVWTAPIACKARVLGLPEDDVEGINAVCPDGNCLGTFCRESSASCFRNCEPAYVFHESSEESECLSTVCPVADGLPGDECVGTYCLYCPGGEDEDCIYVPGDQEFCENTVACELADGGVVFGLTEEECDAQTGSCSVDCPGESCRSLDGLNGVCLATVGSETLCENLNSISGVNAIWYEDSICVVNAETLSTCTELSSLISVPTNWETCESVEVSSCNGEETFQRYLKCFVDLWHRCESQGDCENSGHCADRFWTTIVQSAEHPIDVQFGACFTSGQFFSPYRDPYCLVTEERTGIGCQDHVTETPEECLTGGDVWRTWLTPAMSETECRSKALGRYGCQQPGIEEHLIWLDDVECECRGGVSDYAWEWTQGVWINNGVSRTLHWKEVEPVQKYQWTPMLSFKLLQTWLEANEEQRLSFAVKSEVICENEYISSSLATVVCDCSSNSDGGDSQCHVETNEMSARQVEQLVGVTGACVDELSFVKGPVSRVSFDFDSITTRCTLVNLSIVSEAWFVIPPPRPSISFGFEDKPQRGIVLNQKTGSTVGILRGDGTVLSFSMSSYVRSFSVCLLVSGTNISKYLIPDFGYSKKPVGPIFPLGISNLNTTFVFGSRFWCGTIDVDDIPTDGNTIRLYPISRVEDFEDEDEEYTSLQTRALMYTLGVCYCICFVLLAFYLINFAQSLRKTTMLPIISFLLSILCVFRVVFMFGYPNAIFEGNELAEFVVFEIPTFLLFSVVICSIYFWKKLSSRKKFFISASDSLRWVVILGLVLVWSLWVIVTIIYSEVILEEDGESPCPGRIALSFDKQEEDTRTMTIIYQSLIIFVTFVLGVVFCYYSYQLVKLSKNVTRSKRFVLVIGGVLVFSFLIRSILFIIILALEFTSSVYMFITLMITEVFVIFFIQLQFNFATFRSLIGGSSTGSISGSRAGRSVNVTPQMDS